jgi:hypothetical protein
MTQLTCSGWWEQEGYGRQPMNDLQLTFSDGKIFAQGWDMVGEFEFTGTLTQDHIYLFKKYIGKHSIEYHGVSIGEGIYTGDWTCWGAVGGKWLIRIERSTSTGNYNNTDIQDL